MKVIMVKKILANGQPCEKCNDVQERLETSGYINRVDRVVEAVENDPGSEGMMLADLFQVDKAPFFIVESQGHGAQIYTVYFKLVKEVFESAVS